MPSPERLAAALKARAAGLGFDLCRIASAEAPPEPGDCLAEWLRLGRHGEMAWMDDARRAAPRALWPEARTCVVVGLNYGPARDPREATRRPGVGAVSVYARARDYHDVLKGRLKLLASGFAAEAGADVKVFVDTAPVMEKPLAARAGLGWQGKHTNLVSRDFGSWLFLGAMFTTAELPPDAPESDHCGACRRCLDACPTGALPAPYQIDARACISYLTIELKGPIPLEHRRALGNRIYGCDDCLAVCPWNKFAEAGAEAKLTAPDWRDPPLEELAALDDAAFRRRFAGSPIKRIGRNRFVRNVLIAIGNARDPEMLEAVRARLDDASPLVRGAAIWALSEISPGEARRLAGQHCDSDADVAAEWRRASELD